MLMHSQHALARMQSSLMFDLCIIHKFVTLSPLEKIVGCFEVIMW